MRLLVSGATKTMRMLASKHPDNLGVLVTPQNGNDLGSSLRSFPYWACDNAAFSNPDDTKFWNLFINTWQWIELNPPMWIACPDVVGNHSETLDLFHQWTELWEYEIGYIPHQLAFVLQNGATIDTVPWDSICAVFVGGDDRFKLRESEELVRHAKSIGKLVHIGRVNTQKRLRYSMQVGADTVDGTSFSMFPDKRIEWAINFIKRTSLQGELF